MSEPAIDISGLGRRYRLYTKPMDRVLDAFGLGGLVRNRAHNVRDFWALRDLALTVKKGERLGIVGRNGAGKSTLLKIIAGTLNATEGELTIRGRVQAMLELGTGFHPEFTGRANIHASLAYQGLSKAEIDEREPEIIDFAELESFIDQPIKTYSAGMLARLAFSVATSVEPEILIIDEVLGAGDAYFAGKCVERMRALTERSGATVLFVSHDLSSVQHLCDRAIWIDRGSIVRDGEPLDVIQSYQAVVRSEDEARLRARDRRVSKAHELSANIDEEVFETLLFHFVGDGGRLPSGPSVVRSIRLMVGDEEVSRIDVGGPMDNDASRDAHILDTPGYMDWAEPMRRGGVMSRAVADLGGSYAHAPFQFRVAKSYRHARGEPRLVIDAAAAGEPVVIELFDQDQYRRVGTLTPGHDGEHALSIDWPGSIDEEPGEPAEEGVVAELKPSAQPLPEAHEYGLGGARILAVRFFGADDSESRVLTVQEPARVEIEYDAQSQLDDPVFVFAAYLPDGRPVTQWITRASEHGSSIVEGRGVVRFVVSPLLLGRGSYIASAAIFRDLRPDGLEPDAYHLLDRCLHFQVVQPTGENYELGLCAQPFSAELHPGARTPVGVKEGAHAD